MDPFHHPLFVSNRLYDAFQYPLQYPLQYALFHRITVRHTVWYILRNASCVPTIHPVPYLYALQHRFQNKDPYRYGNRVFIPNGNALLHDEYQSHDDCVCASHPFHVHHPLPHSVPVAHPLTYAKSDRHRSAHLRLGLLDTVRLLGRNIQRHCVRDNHCDWYRYVHQYRDVQSHNHWLDK